ncbi:hypothetical protein LfDm3_0615 [Fructilactobacillus fructivorans]|uniref:Uncharacterized protein n=1 Tax=Fructilactobacillus fructivorans TaxID=1614 RepID=A0A0C1PMG0_9LACO|nr:hypothetical protein LfDm3_0615 [Fructilactobacillus fructivorans]
MNFLTKNSLPIGFRKIKNIPNIVKNNVRVLRTIRNGLK